MSIQIHTVTHQNQGIALELISAAYIGLIQITESKNQYSTSWSCISTHIVLRHSLTPGLLLDI